MKFRFARFVRHARRPATPRRLAAAERHLRKEREKYPLFADEIAEEQPTPEERIESFEEGCAAFWLNMRNHLAKSWRKGRATLRTHPLAEQQLIIAAWNAAGCPAEAAYFVTFLQRWAATREQLLRPLSADEERVLARIGNEWVRAIDLTPADRLHAHELQIRGRLERRVNNNLIEWRTTT